MPVEEQHHRRLHNWEPYDKITMEVVPRFKTSGMSGDEWRTSVVVEFWFKGQKIREEVFGNMNYAIMMLGHAHTQLCEPFLDEVLEIEKTTCDQPGCSNLATTPPMRIKEAFSRQGEKLDPSETGMPWLYYRRFCSKHKERGDASREDCDDNYEVAPR